jgi:squalene monooxygenase
MGALASLGLSWCTEDIDAAPVYGYCVVYEGKQVAIPYPNRAEGRSFHHGEFIMQLRKAARMADGVDLIEATVTELIECTQTGRVTGVRANRKDPSNPTSLPLSESLYAEIIIAADGAYSKFRSALGTTPRAPTAKSNFFGAILKHAPLPMKHHGTVALIPGCGPVLMYQIGSTETRMLADVRLPLPSDVKAFLSNEMVPGLPAALRPCVLEALKSDRLRSMPNQFLPATMQGQYGSKEGVILIGDAWNMRHPLTGGA